MRHVARRERITHHVGDYRRRLLGLAGPNGAARTNRLTDGASLIIRDDGVGLGAAAVDANHDIRHADSVAALGAGPCVKEERMPTVSVIVVPISTYHG